MNAHPLRVLIAEDNADLRDLLVTLVSAEPDLKCVGTADDVDAVIATPPSTRPTCWCSTWSCRVARASTC